MTQKNTLFRCGKQLILLAACFVLALILLGGVKVSAASTDVTTEQGTFTIGYGGSGYNKYDAPTVIGYKGSKSDVTLPTKVTINDVEQAITILGSAFKSNTAITSVTIPEGYTSIEGSALSGCTGLTSISIPGSLTQVGYSAFEGCTSLTTVTFAENAAGSLKFMNKPFNGCTALKTINLPIQTSNVNSDGNIFTGCTALESITVSAGNAKYFSADGSLYAKNDKGTGAILCTYVNIPAELTIPATAGDLPVTAIGVMAFYENTAITSVTVPSSVTTFERSCFSYCSNLKTLVLQCETAPTLNSSVFTYLADGSTIYVPNETVASAFTSSHYTSGKTTVQVGTPAVTTAAAVSIESAGYADGKVSFDLYLDSATEVSVVMLNLSFDAAKLGEGTVTVADSAFKNNNFEWKTDDGTLTAVLQFGKIGEGNLNYTERTKLATITLPVQTGVSGEVTATLAQALVAGAGDVGGMVEASITTASAAARILSCDVNGDGKIDLKDIAEAQRYYQAKDTDNNWSAAQSSDVNGDGEVNIEDYIVLFHAVVEAMGW